LADSALEESIPHLGALLGRQSPVNRGSGDSQALKLRWKFLLSTLVYAISSQSHPIALVFEDLHWADADTLGEFKRLVIFHSITSYE
jgi:predicted ATPase